MSGKFTQAADDVAAGSRLIREGAPAAMSGFAALAAAATAPGALDSKTKELMALAVGIAARAARRSPRPSRSRSTWAAARPRSTAPTRCAP